MSFGAAPPGMDEYQRLMADRAAAAKRKRLMFGVVAIAVVGAFAPSNARSPVGSPSLHLPLK